METNGAQWLTKQYSKPWSAHGAARVTNQGKCQPMDSESSSTQSPKDVKTPILLVQYRGNQGQYFANKLQRSNKVQLVFTKRKLQSCLAQLKTAISKNLKSILAHKVACNGSSGTYVDTVLHLTTRLEEHKKQTHR